MARDNVMTEQEAIEVLKNNYPKMCKMVNGRYQGGFDNTESDFGQALTMAISVLKEIQQYREIGTVEELKQLKEILPYLKSCRQSLDDVVRKCNEYEKIGTVEECREAVEKQKAKKPKDSLKINPVIDGNGAYVDADTTIYLLCPNCEELVGIGENCDNYCRECGQKIDGENLEETEDVEGEMHTCKIQSKEKGAGNC